MTGNSQHGSHPPVLSTNGIGQLFGFNHIPTVTASARWWKSILVNVSIGLAVLALAFAAVAGFSVWKIHHWPPPPNEEHLREVFTAKRELFEQVIRMVSEDRNVTLTVGNGLLYSERLPQERVQEYRNVVSGIGPKVKFSVASGRAPSFTFEEETIGLAIGSHFADGIDYIPPTDEKFVKIVKSVDEAKALKLPEYWVPVSGRWYLFHTED